MSNLDGNISALNRYLDKQAQIEKLLDQFENEIDNSLANIMEEVEYIRQTIAIYETEYNLDFKDEAKEYLKDAICL